MTGHLLTYPNFLFIAISVIGLAIASYTDVKKREVPNALSYGIFLIGIIGNLFFAFTSPGILNLGNWAIGLITGIAIAVILGLTGAWAGGDTKLFIAITALSGGLLFLENAWIFPIAWLALSVLSILPYAGIVTIMELQKKPKIAQKVIQKMVLKIPLAIFLGGAGGIAIGLAMGLTVNMYAVLVTGLAVAVFTTVLELARVSSELFSDLKKISELKEGDIIGENIYEENGKIVREITSGQTLINQILTNTQEKRTYIARGGNANGMELNEINQLQEFVKKGQLENAIPVKKSLALVPALALGYVITIGWGEIIWNMFL